jgi:predicted aconitase
MPLHLNPEQQAMLDGDCGKSVRKAMEILVALGEIYGAEKLRPVSSVQIAGVSYDNLGEAGLEFLTEMAEGNTRVRVLTTLNPAGMDIENWQALGISPEFARQQNRVLEAFARMGVTSTCTCTPYLAGNLPHFNEHIAWAESSAVAFANSVIGARSNREGGPSALAAALTGFTPACGLHLDEFRRPGITFQVTARLTDSSTFAALGKAIGLHLEKLPGKPVPYISGIPTASLEDLKAFCASVATYGGIALFHISGITPEATAFNPPEKVIDISQPDLDSTLTSLSDADSEEVDFVSLGCPHLSIQEISRLASLLDGKKVRKEFWVTTARPTKQIADQMGYTRIIEQSGAKFAVDTCCVVAPIRGRFHAIATDSAKACYYAYSKNHFKTRFLSFEQVVMEALQ